MIYVCRGGLNVFLPFFFLEKEKKKYLRKITLDGKVAKFCAIDSVRMDGN